MLIWCYYYSSADYPLPFVLSLAYFRRLLALWYESLIKIKYTEKNSLNFSTLNKQQIFLKLISKTISSPNNREWKRPENPQMDKHIQVSDVCYSF